MWCPAEHLETQRGMEAAATQLLVLSGQNCAVPLLTLEKCLQLKLFVHSVRGGLLLEPSVDGNYALGETC